MSSASVLAAVVALDAADVATADGAQCAALLGELRLARGWLDAFEAQVTSRMRLLHDTAGGAPAADLHARCGAVSTGEARRKQRRSETLDDVPSFGDALADGEIGAEHVDALANATARLDDDTRHQLFDLEPDLLDDARRLSPERFGRSVRDLARRLERDGGLERNHQQRRDTFLSRRLDTRSGMIEGRFAFHPELANQIFTAVDRHVAAMISNGEHSGDPDFADRTIDRNRLTAEALGQLIAAGHDRVRPLEADITVIIDADTLTTGTLHDHSVSETGDGLGLPPASIQRLACHGRITPIIIDTNGTVLDAGRTLRHANRTQRRALRAMYRTCAHGDCDTNFDRCEIHHIIPWELGGPTDLSNLIPLCSKHHHLIHEHHWTLELAHDRTLTIRQPNGQTTTSHPDMPPRHHHQPERQQPHRQQPHRQQPRQRPPAA